MRYIVADNHNGFTLVEFIVIMGIFAIMVGVVMFNFNGFRSNVTSENLAQDIALSIRQIQSSAGAGLSTDDPETEIRQGIYFPVESGAYKNEFILFRDDIVSNNTYDDGEAIDIVRIQTPDTITEIFYGETIDSARQQLSGEPLAITFGRYRTSATFSDATGDTDTAGVVRIQIISPDGTQIRYISVTRIGEVSVQSEASQ